MALAFHALRTYSKLALIALVAVCIILVLAFNWRNTADVWFFHKFESVNVLWLLLITAAGSIVSFWIVSKVFGALRELRALRLERQKKRQLGEQRELAKKLEERERRIDEKLRRSIADESESS